MLIELWPGCAVDPYEVVAIVMENLSVVVRLRGGQSPSHRSPSFDDLFRIYERAVVRVNAALNPTTATACPDAASDPEIAP